jgi:hypothetical protein
MKPVIVYQIKECSATFDSEKWNEIIGKRWFETKEEAIKIAYETNKWRHWHIIEVLSFDNF